MKQVLTIILTLLISASLFGQTQLGIGVSGYQSILTGIRDDLPRGNGWSGNPTISHPTYCLATHLYAQNRFSQLFELEYGIGYFQEKERITILETYIPGLFGTPDDSREFELDIHYLSIPIGGKIFLPTSSSNELFIGGDLTTLFVIGEKNNYELIIFEDIGLGWTDYYNPTFKGRLCVGYKKGNIEVSAFYSRDLRKYIKRDWGFYKDLETSKNTRYGIELKYFFTSFSLIKK